jgi:ribosomal protein S18 acetylase RimI-like enzyme
MRLDTKLGLTERGKEMSDLKITIVGNSERDTAVRAVVTAFSDDPAARWMYPDSERYQKHFPVFVNAFGGAAFEHYSAYCCGADAAALWLPPGVHPDEEALAALIRRSVPERDQAEVFAFFSQMDGYHPSEPHWYLPMIGVVPEKQGQGYGSALLGPVLERCDAEGKLAYLEASSSRSVPLYERHGFKVVGKIQAGASPTMFPMVRKPNRSAGRKEGARFSQSSVESSGAELMLK